MRSDPPEKFKFYRHYKGGLYLVLVPQLPVGVTPDKKNQPGLVVREVHVYYVHVSGSLHSREIEEWFEEIPGKPDVKRFEMLDANFRFEVR